jgi:hypothetical protein
MNSQFPIQNPQNASSAANKSVLGSLLNVFANALSNKLEYHCLIQQSDGTQQIFMVDQPFFDKFTQLQTDSNETVFAWLNVDWQNLVLDWRIFEAPIILGELWPIYQSCYQFELLYRLIRFGHFLQSPVLKQFFWNCFKQQDFMRKFVAVPASRAHHHSVPSGLLEHSLECVMTAYKNLPEEMSQNEKELTLLAALFHDAGKVLTLNQFGLTDLGFSVQHESLSLMALATPLTELMNSWRSGYEVFIYLLSWNSRQGLCQYVGGYIINLADQISTNRNLRKASFKHKPENHQFAFYQAGSMRQKICRLN